MVAAGEGAGRGVEAALAKDSCWVGWVLALPWERGVGARKPARGE